nr:tetratricopeptide repeat protein [Actinomycetota bacterium]
RVGSVEEIGGCLVNLGLAHMHRGALEDAIACDRRAIEEFERVRHGSGRATVYVNLAEKLMKAGELQEALAYCERALELASS